MLGSLGLVPAQGAGIPPVGVEYVLATPSGRAVLRPLRYPFYDTAELSASTTKVVTLFSDHKKFDAGGTKTECDTNMTLDSQLGHPNLFDLVGFVGETPFGVSAGNFNVIYNNFTYRYIFGQNTVFTRTTLRKIPTGIGQYGFDSTGTVVTNGLPVLGNFYNFTTPDRKARRIDSVEQFRAELNPCVTPAITGTVKFTIYMLGVLYSNL